MLVDNGRNNKWEEEAAHSEKIIKIYKQNIKAIQFFHNKKQFDQNSRFLLICEDQ